jgi:hypothetical protein
VTTTDSSRGMTQAKTRTITDEPSDATVQTTAPAEIVTRASDVTAVKTNGANSVHIVRAMRAIQSARSAPSVLVLAPLARRIVDDDLDSAIQLAASRRVIACHWSSFAQSTDRDKAIRPDSCLCQTFAHRLSPIP